MTLEVDLKKQPYEVFDLTDSDYLNLKSKNFIFGKNGRGKSTLTKIIENEFGDEYNVFIFDGFNNIAVNEQLNAIILGEDNKAIQRSIDEIDNAILALENKEHKVKNKLASLDKSWDFSNGDIKEHELLQKEIKQEKIYNQKREKVQLFLKQKAKFLKEMTNPRITKTNYNRDDLKEEIYLANKLEEQELKKYIAILKTENKEEIESYSLFKYDFENLHKMVLEIIEYELCEEVLFEELSDSDQKRFAETGISLHEPEDECLFCGNTINKDRYFKLERYFRADEIINVREKAEILISNFTKIKNSIKSIKSDKKLYFEHLEEELHEIEKKYKSVLLEERNYIDELIKALEEKIKTPYSINIAVPNLIESQFDLYINEHNKIIKNHNILIKNFRVEKDKAKHKLRYHYISEIIKEKDEYKSGWAGYLIEDTILQQYLENFRKSSEELNDEINKLEGINGGTDDDNLRVIRKQIDKLSKDRKTLLDSVQSTEKWVGIINDKLNRIGKTNLKLCLTKSEDNIEHYVIQDNDGTRDITKLSTGEKNIISFLYFMESLIDLRNNHQKNKIIIFDDPMNSNDDTMQYLIIQELLELYRGVNSKKYNHKKDYFICLTHNVHFYLNIQPYETKVKEKYNAKGEKCSESKYTRMNFYRIDKGRFIKINNEKEDLSSHYDALWFELKEMYEL